MISSTQMRPGMVIKFNNELYTIFRSPLIPAFVGIMIQAAEV